MKFPKEATFALHTAQIGQENAVWFQEKALSKSWHCQKGEGAEASKVSTFRSAEFYAHKTFRIKRVNRVRDICAKSE